MDPADLLQLLNDRLRIHLSVKTGEQGQQVLRVELRYQDGQMTKSTLVDYDEVDLPQPIGLF